MDPIDLVKQARDQLKAVEPLLTELSHQGWLFSLVAYDRHTLDVSNGKTSDRIEIVLEVFKREDI